MTALTYSIAALAILLGGLGVAGVVRSEIKRRRMRDDSTTVIERAWRTLGLPFDSDEARLAAYRSASDSVLAERLAKLVRDEPPEKIRRRRETLILGDGSVSGIRNVTVEDLAGDPVLREKVLGMLRLTSLRGVAPPADET